MSSFIFDLDDLKKLKEFYKNRTDQFSGETIRCRVIAQYMGIEYLEPENNTGDDRGFCNIKVRNLSNFQNINDSVVQKREINFMMDENVYESTFMNGTSSNIQKGAACDLKVVFWSSGQEIDDTLTMWEVLDLKVLSVAEVQELHEFCLSDEGKEFLEISNPINNILN